MSIITEQDRIDTLAAAIVHREREVFSYQINIDNYTAMLAALPEGDWPADLVQYQNTPVENLPMSMPDEDVQAIGDYQYRDRLLKLLRSEKIEQGKSQRVLDAMRSQIPAEVLDAAVAAAKAKIDG